MTSVVLPRRPPAACPSVTLVRERLLIGGLGGGLTTEGIECIFQEHAVTHLVVCGHHGIDVHVDAAEAAAGSCDVEVHVAPLVPADVSKLSGIVSAAREFVADALNDELNCVLVACSKGASRSVAIVLAHLMTSEALTLREAFDSVVVERWRVWPSALLVETLLEMRAQRGAAAASQGVVSHDSVCRRIGSHAALATAWHNRIEADRIDAEAAWDALAVCPLEAMFAMCKQRLLGHRSDDLGSFTSTPLGCGASLAHSEAAEVVKGIFLCGLGGLAPSAISSILQKHDIVHVVVCGRVGRDAHVDSLRAAVASWGLSEDAVHLVPIADSASEDLHGHLKAAVAFIRAAATGTENVLVACRQGASRSVSVVVAYLMKEQGMPVLQAFQSIAERRWRLWPNAGFVQQLLRLEDDLRSTSGRGHLEESDRLATLRSIGVHAAWASNRQNMEETGFGRQDLTLGAVDALWDQAYADTKDIEECFERVKELALGVDIAAFAEVCETPSSKKPRIN